jgi:hypothetical protein
MLLIWECNQQSGRCQADEVGAPVFQINRNYEEIKFENSSVVRFRLRHLKSQVLGKYVVV